MFRVGASGLGFRRLKPAPVSPILPEERQGPRVHKTLDLNPPKTHIYIYIYIHILLCARQLSSETICAFTKTLSNFLAYKYFSEIWCSWSCLKWIIAGDHLQSLFTYVLDGHGSFLGNM